MSSIFMNRGKKRPLGLLICFGLLGQGIYPALYAADSTVESQGSEQVDAPLNGQDQPTDDNDIPPREDEEAGGKTDQAVISVTASRVASEVQHTPAAITVIDRETLERVKFIDSRNELMRRIPGFSMVRNLRIPIGGKNYTINLIDGLATSAAFGSGTIGSLDDTNTFDIERVEVIRGPASALYGSNAVGGVINVITRDPPAEPEYRVWGEVGEYDRLRGGFSAAGSNDALGYFVDANFLDYEGWQDRTNNERRQFSGKLLYTPDIDAIYTFRVEYLDRNEENPGSLTQAQYDEDWQQALVDDAYNDEESISAAFKYERDLNSHSGIELSYGIRNNQDEGPPSYSPTSGFSSSDDTNQNLVGLYRHGFDWNSAQLIVGIDLLHSDSLDKGFSERDPSSDISQKWDITAVTHSPFFQYELSPRSWLHLTLGGRYDRIEYGAEGFIISRGTTTDYDESTSFSHFSPKAGVTFDLNPRNSFWIGYGQGFVVPSRTNLFVGSRGIDPNPDLDPEKATNYELGLRGKIRDGWLSYDITLYHTKINDMLVSDGNLDLYVNAGEVLVEGVESAIGFVPGRDWRIDLTHTYADNQYVDYVSGSSDYSGNTLSSSPKHHIDTRITWMPLRGLSAELEWNHISSYYTSSGNDDPDGKADRPDLLNLRLAYERGPWSIWGDILNLADKKYAERVSYSASKGRSFSVGVPRTISMGLAYHW